MKTQAAVIARDPVYLSWLKEALGPGMELHWVRPDDPAEPVPAQLLGIDDLELAFVEAGADSESAELLELLADENPLLLLVAVGADSPTDSVLDAMRAGARDFFVMGRDDRQLSERLRKLMRKSASTHGIGERSARIYSIHSSPGGQAMAWTAEHLALALLDDCRPGDKVLLLDMAQPYGASLVFLNLAQNYSLLDAVQDVHRCDATLIDTAFVKHSSGLHVLSLPEDLVEPTRMDERDLLALLDVLAKHFHSIVVCCSSNLGIESQAGVVARARAGFMISDGSILNSRSNKHLLKALRLEECPLDRLGLVVDSDGIAKGLDAPSLAQLIELPLWAEMPVNYQNRLRAMNAGEPLYTQAPKDPYCRAMRDLARRLAVQDPKNLVYRAESSGLLQRIFGD